MTDTPEQATAQRLASTLELVELSREIAVAYSTGDITDMQARGWVQRAFALGVASAAHQPSASATETLMRAEKALCAMRDALAERAPDTLWADMISTVHDRLESAITAVQQELGGSSIATRFRDLEAELTDARLKATGLRITVTKLEAQVQCRTEALTRSRPYVETARTPDYPGFLASMLLRDIDAALAAPTPTPGTERAGVAEASTSPTASPEASAPLPSPEQS